MRMNAMTSISSVQRSQNTFDLWVRNLCYMIATRLVVLIVVVFVLVGATLFKLFKENLRLHHFTSDQEKFDRNVLQVNCEVLHLLMFMSAYWYCADFCKIFTFTGSLKKDVGDFISSVLVF